MAVNLKKFRKIQIEDQTYYWRVAPDQWMVKLLITKSGDNAYPFLETYFNQTVRGESGNTEQRLITPKLVRQTIVLGLEQGWKPCEKNNQPFRLDNNER